MDLRNVTVFGGAGFLGRHLVRRLAKRGAVVRIAVRRPEEAGFLKTMGGVGQIVPVAANVRDEGSVAAAVAGADTVVSLVGILYEKGRQTFPAVHEKGAGNVARAARAAGVERLLHVSALGADAGSPSAYARTKAAGEEAVRAAFPGAVVFRPSIVIGPEDGFFNRFAALARLFPALPLIGGGRTRFQPVYVGDVTDAMVAALANPASRGLTYEIGGPNVYTFRELMEFMLGVIERRRLLVPVPFPLAGVLAWFLEGLPVPPLTRDQIRLLETDNVVSEGALTLADLGIAPAPIETIVPTYLRRFRPRGGTARAEERS